MFVEQFLARIGLEKYIKTFIDNGISTKDTLLLLGDAEVKELIPLMGHRLIFSKGIVGLRCEKIDPKERVEKRHETTDKGKSPVCIMVPHTSTDDSFSLPVFEMRTPSKETEHDSESQTPNLTPQRKKSTKSPCAGAAKKLHFSSPGKDKAKAIERGRINKKPSPKKKSPKKLSPKKAMSTANETTYVEEYENINTLTDKEKEERVKFIKEVLDETNDGKAVLSSLQQNLFDDLMRKHLVDALVNKEMSKTSTYRITAERFKYLAIAIKLLAPTENPLVYYIPGISLGKGQKVNPRGKLFEAYSTKRRMYRKYGLCESLYKTKSNLTVEEEVVPQLTEEDLALINEAFEWLKLQSDPYEEVAKRWTATSEYRLEKFFNSSETATQYMSRFAALKKDFGHRLLSLDFQRLYPEKHGEFFNNWPSVAEKIIQYIQEKCHQSSNFKGIIKAANFPDLSGDLVEEERNFFALTALAYLVKPGKLGSKTKYTHIESQESLYLKVDTPENLKEKLLQRNEIKAKTKTPIQPSLVFVGNDPAQFDSYCEVNETLYSATSIIQAIDICFKCFFALNLQYPPPSARVWHFIQRHVYGITTQGEKADPNVELLATNLKLTV